MKRQGWIGSLTRLVYGIVLLAGFASVTPPAEAQVPAVAPPITEAPSYSVGDEWRFTNGTIIRVVDLEGEYVVTTAVVPTSRLMNCPDCRQYRDKNFTIVKIMDKNGAEVQIPEIGTKGRDFPLHIGKKWSYRHNLRTLSTGQVVPYDNSYEVEAYEDVKTKAGTFKAFRISYLQENRGNYRWSGRSTSWYSPEVKATIKRVAHARDFGDDWELESYVLK